MNAVWWLHGKASHSYTVTSAPLTQWVIITEAQVQQHAVTAVRCQVLMKYARTLVLYCTGYRVSSTNNCCTSQPNQWLKPNHVRQVPYLELERIDFTTAEKSMKCFYSQHEITAINVSSS